MGPKKYLYGELNKEMQKSNYGGGKTDSLEIIVNNDTGIITGNVLWQDILGEEPGKAYPGELGKNNANKLSTLASQLLSEINRSKREDEALGRKISAEEQARIRAIETLYQYINTSLSGVPDDIEDRLLGVEENASEALSKSNLLSNQLTSEILTRSSEVELLTENLGAECSRATTAEAELLSRITDEETARASAIDALYDYLSIKFSEEHEKADARFDKVEEDVSDVTTDLELLTQHIKGVEANSSMAHDVLRQFVMSEVDKLVHADENIISNLEQETTERQKADTRIRSELKSDISILSKRVDDIVNNGLDASVFTMLEEETNARVTADDAIRSELTSGLSELSEKVDTSYEQLSRDILDIKQNDSTADIYERLDAEEYARQQSDEAIQEYISDRMSSIESLHEDDITALKDADKLLQQYIDDEIHILKLSDESLDSKFTNLTDGLSSELDEEVRQREATDESLKTHIDESVAKLTADVENELDEHREASNIKFKSVENSIKSVSDKSDALSKKLDNSIKSVSDKIDAETTARVAKDKALEDSITVTTANLYNSLTANINAGDQQNRTEINKVATQVTQVALDLNQEKFEREQSIKTLEQSVNTDLIKIQDELSDHKYDVKSDISAIEQKVNSHIEMGDNRLSNLESEVNDKTSELFTSVHVLTDDVTKLESDVQTLDSAVQKEISRSVTKDNELEARLNTLTDETIPDIVSDSIKPLEESTSELYNIISAETQEREEAQNKTNSKISNIESTILSNTDRIDDEVNRAKNAEQQLSERIDEHSDTISEILMELESIDLAGLESAWKQDLDDLQLSMNETLAEFGIEMEGKVNTALSDQQSVVDSKISEMESTTSALNERVANEISRAMSEESSIRQNISALDKEIEDTKTSISIEKAERVASIDLLEDIVQNAIDTHSSDRAKLESAIKAEAQDRISGDTQLDNKIDELVGELNENLTATDLSLKATTARLTNQILTHNYDIESLQLSDTAFSKKLDAEIQRSTEEDLKLITGFRDLNTTVSNEVVHTHFDSTKNETKVYTVRNNINGTLVASDRANPNVVIVRDGYGNISATRDVADLSNLQPDSAVPKKYVDDQLEGIADKVADKVADPFSIKIISGGTAPVPLK